MEIVKHPTTADEALVWFWQRYVTGESRVHHRVTFRDQVGRFASAEVPAALPQARAPRSVTVHDFIHGDYQIQL